jgi:putative transferase (TIGR04331 family)
LNIFDRNIEIDFGGQSLNQRLTNSRLAVVTYNETTIPANLIANFPTVALWDPKYVRLNDQATSVYDELQKAKILFHSQIDAAQHISYIWSDVDGWWNSEVVQSARLNYCNHYAHRVRFPALTVASVIADSL